MRALRLAVVSAAAACLGWAAYTPYYQHALTSAGSWQANGTNPQTSAVGMVGSGSFISTVAVPGGSNDYEVNTVINLPMGSDPPNPNLFTIYLRATNDAVVDGAAAAAQGTYYAVSVRIDTWFTFHPNCNATLTLTKRVGGSITSLSSRSFIGCRDNLPLRAGIRGNKIYVWLDNVRYIDGLTDSSISAGKPGVGVINGNTAPNGGASLAGMSLYAGDVTAPGTVSSLTSVRLGTQAAVKWAAASDDANGSGVALYQVYRDWVYLGDVYPWQELTWVDRAWLDPAYPRTYNVVAVDYLGNASAGTDTSAAATTANSLDAKRWGVHGEGVHWGGAGESIDMRSGNMNFTLPLVRAQGRAGTGITLALSYNSQLWRRSGASTDWRLGMDVGYGYGWRLNAGSLTPIWNNASTLGGFLFTDASGAEYRLDQYDSSLGYWSGADNYVTYNGSSPTGLLVFNDGSFWQLNSVSDIREPDAGTRYPTIFQDTNGNQVFLYYQSGLGGSGRNTSARLERIWDVRKCCNPNNNLDNAYTFQWDNAGDIPRLTGITNFVNSGENYTFGMSAVQSLSSPWAGGGAYCTAATVFCRARMLTSVTNSTVNLTHNFTYPTAGTGELGTVQYPLGGELRWQYGAVSYGNSAHQLRVVNTRQLKMSSSGTLYTYTLQRDTPGTAWFHGWSLVRDADGKGEKKYTFGTTAGQTAFGLLTLYEGRDYAANQTKTQSAFTWGSDATGHRYVNSVTSTTDPGQSYQKQSKTEQALDSYANVTLRYLYDYGNLTSAVRWYSYTYENAPDYMGRYIRNRLKTATVGGSGGSYTLGTMTYDNYGGGNALIDRPNAPMHNGSFYNTSYAYRGNPTHITKLGSTAQTVAQYDVMGVAEKLTQGSTTVQTTLDTATLSVPAVITPNSDTSKNVSLTYNTWLGLTQQIEPNGATTTIQYNPTTARPDKTTAETGAETFYTYSSPGVWPAWTRAVTNGKWVKTYVDGFGRTILLETGNDTTGTVSKVSTEYEPCACSPLGKLKRVSRPYAGASPTDWTVYNYDALGRTTSVQLPGTAGSTTYLYQGNEVTVTDPAGKWKRFTSNALGELTKVTEPNPGSGGGGGGSFTPVRVNAGGAQLTDATNQVWEADNGFSGGNSSAGTVTVTNVPVQDRDLFKFHREGGAPITYTRTGLPAGTYNIRLRFAEVWGATPGQRRFSFTINGTTAESDFDIAAQAGGAGLAIDRNYSRTLASAGSIVVQFTTITGGTIINAIEITQSAAGGGSFTPARVNAGGAQLTDSMNQVWEADSGFSGGNSSAGTVTVTNVPVQDRDLFKYHREGGAPITYTRSGLPAGTYNIRLRFAEVWGATPGQRRFSFTINGTTAESDFDIAAQAGGAGLAIDRNYSRTLTSTGSIVVQFTTITGGTVINAIEITQTSGGGGGGGGGPDFETTYSYNALGKLTQVAMPRGTVTQTRTFTYNSLGQLYQATNPETGTVTYAYNANGQVQTFTDAKGQVRDYAYDSFLRLSTVTRKTSAAVTEGVTTYTYDQSLGYASNFAGRLVRVSETSPDPTASGQTITISRVMSYTVAGLVDKARLEVAKGSTAGLLEETASYNNEGQMLTWKMPDSNGVAGPQYVYNYDNQGRVQSVTFGGSTLVSGVQYNAAGQVTSMAYEGWTETRQFNVLGQMTRLTVGGGSVADWEYTFPASGNSGRISKMKDYVTGEEVNYQYDSLNRLISAATTPGAGTQWGLSFTY